MSHSSRVAVVRERPPIPDSSKTNLFNRTWYDEPIGHDWSGSGHDMNGGPGRGSQGGGFGNWDRGKSSSWQG
eukprot:2430993-Alexandrium_andersonii.AAC.1